MKSNQELGFTPLYGNGDGYGPDRSWENDSYIGTYSLHATIGRRGNQYRVYAHLWHNEQDRSREGIRGQCCGRGGSAEEAMANFRNNASATDWHMANVDRILLEMRESIEA